MGSSASSTHKKYAQTVVFDRNQQLEKQLNKIRFHMKELKITKEMIHDISDCTVTQLVNLLNDNKITSKEIMLIFCYRSGTIGREYNLITEENYEMAMALAEQCDKERSMSKKRNWTFQDVLSDEQFLPPLFGIPISVKDCFEMKGKRNTIGMTVRSHTIVEEDGALVKCLKNGGAIPFVRTNASQMLMIFETNNLLWGRSLNIWDRSRSVGGSSGGEAGLIAAKCSPLGFGSDIGGSVRIPALFCGICSLKPSEPRLSTNQQCFFSDTLTGKDTFKSVNGPMARSVQDLSLWLKTVCSEQNYKEAKDPYCKLFAFDSQKYVSFCKQTKLRIGYYTNLQFMQCTPASQRAVEETISMLRSKGHQLVEITIPNQMGMILEYIQELAAEGKSRSLYEILEGEDLIPEYKKAVRISKIPASLKKYVIVPILSRLYPRLATILQKSNQLTSDQYLKHVAKIAKYKQQFYQYWLQKDLNFVIAPGFACQANSHGLTNDLSPTAAYTFIYNILGYTVGTVPITVVKQDEQVYQSKYNDMITTAIRNDVKGTAGLPVGIQVIGLPFQEESVLAFMKIIEAQAKFYTKYPPPKPQLSEDYQLT